MALSALVLSGCLNNHRKAIERYVAAISHQAATLDDEAIKELHAAVRLDNEFSLAYSLLGDLHRKQGDYPSAVTAYEHATELDPYDFNDHLHLGQVYQALTRFYDAIKTLHRACLLQPDSPDANLSLGLCYLQTQDFEQAEVYTSRAARLDPDNPIILASIGQIYEKNGDSYKAVNAYQQALEVNPDQPDIMVKLGAIYTGMKRFPAAKLILEKAAEAAPDQTGPFIALGYCLLNEGWNYSQADPSHNTSLLQGYQEALEVYRRALEIDVKSHQAHNGLGATYMTLYLDSPADMQLAEDAIQAWHNSLDLEPNQPQIARLVEKYSAKIYGPKLSTRPPRSPALLIP